MHEENEEAAEGEGDFLQASDAQAPEKGAQTALAKHKRGGRQTAAAG